MRTLTFLVTVLALVCTAAAEPVDPHSDGMSIYFDEAAMEFCMGEPPTYVAVPMYLVITRPSASEPHVMSWEARVLTESNATYGVDGNGQAQWTYYANAINLGDCVDMIVGCSSQPLPIDGAAIVLAHGGLVWTAPGGYARFSIDRTTGSTTFPEGPGYSTGIGQSYQCQHIFGVQGSYCAWVSPEHFGVDCAAAVANEDKTWSEVKALY